MLFAARPALGNGAFPSASQLLSDPSDPNRLVLRTTFGLLSTWDRGETWDWLCEVGMGYRDVEPPMVVLPGGAILLAVPGGVSRSDPTGCDFEFTTFDATVVDLARIAQEPESVVAVSSTGATAQTWQSRDSGVTFAPLGDELAGLIPLSIDGAPSDKDVIYLSGISGTRGVLVRSDDRGKSFRSFDVPNTTTARVPYIAAVDPGDADTVYVRLNALPSQLAVTRDGGKTFTVVLETRVPVAGFALAPDRKTLLASNSFDGTFRASTETFAFEKIACGGPNCLSYSEGGLFGCGDNEVDGFIIGRSDDLGSTFQRLVDLSCVRGPAACGVETSIGQICPDAWPTVQRQLGASACEPPEVTPYVGCFAGAGGEGAEGAGAASSGGAGGGASGAANGGASGGKPTTAREASGCDCRVVTRGSNTSPWAFIAGVAWLVRRRRQRSSRRAQSSEHRALRAAALFGAMFLVGCADDGPSSVPPVNRNFDELMDPETCAGCHPKAYEDWSTSMHAYAADDPLFIAMNARGQREARIGTFCVNCHAPLAVRTGATTDGLNLAELPQMLKGVTCYFCHSVDSVQGSHNNPLTLASDGAFRGAMPDPMETRAHGSTYSKLLDRDQLESATLCGACHDIVNQHETQLERTFAEWKDSVFSASPGGSTCSQCHMDQSRELGPAASVQGAVPRRTHAHDFPAVDVPITPWPGREALKAASQALLDTTLQSALCVRGAGAATDIRVILDNVAGGHAFPSGAAQDRRAWVELTAYVGDEILYQSGRVPDGTSVTELDDPDVWSIRDCLLGANGEPVHMFWEARAVESTLLPAQLTFDQTDPRFYQGHVLQKYPRGEATLPASPDRVTMRVKLAPFGLDVFDDLVESGDLVDSDRATVAELRASLTPYTLGVELEWTPEKAGQAFLSAGLPMTCVTDTALNVRADTVPAVNHTRCGP